MENNTAYVAPDGLAAMKAKGSHISAQDEQSCTVFGMPSEAAKADLTDEQIPLDQFSHSNCVSREEISITKTINAR